MTIIDQVTHIQQIIIETALNHGRSPQTILLLAVSKGQSIEAIVEAFNAGINNFGENYWQEAQQKIKALSALPIQWHFIGPIQTNKTRQIAQHFSWVHSIDRQKIAELIAKYRPPQLPLLNVCLQINLDDEPNKAGVKPEEAAALACYVNQLPQLKLRGLMAIPKPEIEENKQLDSLLRLAKLLHQLNKQLNLSMDSLSMGMTDDLKAAIRAGSTIVRIGRALFGERNS